MSAPLFTTRAAYEKGRRSQGSQVDSDVALEQFSRKYCPHTAVETCALESAWWDGWDDASEGNRNRQPIHEPQKDVEASA